MAQGIFHTQAGRERMSRWYDTFLARLRVPVESRTVSTRFGDTHLLLAGPADAPPLVVLHGALAGSAHVLGEVQPLARSFRLILPDVIGQSVKSAEVRPPIDDASYGHWLMDVLDALGVRTARVCGASWGGIVAIRAAMAAPERVERLVLLVPGGIARGGAMNGIFRAAIPMAMYRMFPSPKRLRSFVSHQFTTVDEDWMNMLGDAVLNVRFDFRLPKDVTREQLAAFKAPVYVIAADDDVHFPGPAILERSRTVFPNFVQGELLKDCRHSPPFDDGFRESLCAKIAAFLTAPVERLKAS